MNTLPKLTKDQVFCCSNGCGECKAIHHDFVVFEERTMTGELLDQKTEKDWVSDCCKAELLVWDNSTNDFID